MLSLIQRDGWHNDGKAHLMSLSYSLYKDNRDRCIKCAILSNVGWNPLVPGSKKHHQILFLSFFDLLYIYIYIFVILLFSPEMFFCFVANGREVSIQRDR